MCTYVYHQMCVTHIQLLDERTYACIIADSERPQLAAALEVCAIVTFFCQVTLYVPFPPCAQSLDLVVVYSENGKKMPDHLPDECDVVFVCELFEGEAYNYLHSRKFR